MTISRTKKGTVKFGTAQIGNRTPQFANITFRVIFLLLSFGTFMVADYPGMTDTNKLLLLKWFAGVQYVYVGTFKAVWYRDRQAWYR